MSDHASHPDPLTACPNCGFVLAGVAPEPARYCPRCGQETVLHPPSVAEFFHEFVGHYVALEGALWRTLRLLVLRPGQLTREYLAGRRQRYVLPLRLYLSASFLFFLVLKLMPSHEQFVLVRADGGHSQVIAATSADAGAAARSASTAMPALCGTASTGACGWVERRMESTRHEMETDPARTTAEFSAHFLAKAPYAMFFMLPVFAGVLALAYRRRRMRFGEHVVTCMHLMAFWFLLGALAELLPQALGIVFFAIGAIHGTRALHAVHGGRWGWTILRAVAIGLVGSLLLMLGVVLMTTAMVLA